MALHTSCLLPRPRRCGRPCSITRTSGRRLTSRPALNVLSNRFSILRCPRQSCGQLPPVLDQSCPLGGAVIDTSMRCFSPFPTTSVTSAKVVVVGTPTMFATIPTVVVPAVATVALFLFLPVSLRQLSLSGSARRRGRRARRVSSVGP